MDYRLGPLKGNRMLIAAVGEAINSLTHLSRVGSAEALQDRSGQDAEPYFDLAQDRRQRLRSGTPPSHPRDVVPLSHPPGHAQCDYGEALVIPSASSGQAMTNWASYRCPRPELSCSLRYSGSVTSEDPFW